MCEWAAAFLDTFLLTQRFLYIYVVFSLFSFMIHYSYVSTLFVACSVLKNGLEGISYWGYEQYIHILHAS